MRTAGSHFRSAGRSLTSIAFLLLATLLFAPAARADDAAPIAGAFVYPVGDEFDYGKPRSGEYSGFYVSGEFLDTRGRKRKRVHRGVDLSNGRSGAEVRSVASGVVEAVDANALIKVRRKQKVKVPVMVDGKKVMKTKTRTRTIHKWRTGWGNYVVVRHTLKNGQTVLSLYGHLAPKSVLVKKGDLVSAGQPLGKVGRTGRASSAHLHLEIRKSLPAEGTDENLVGGEEPEEKPKPEELHFARLATIDPLPFLGERVVRFNDLEPGTWQARYALAALRDGLLAGDRDKFEPDDQITRADFYRALMNAFRLATPFTSDSYASTVDALVDSGILDSDASRQHRPGDPIERADALELTLRCLDRSAARARSLASLTPDKVAVDFISRFAGADAAAQSLTEAQAKAKADYEARKKKAAAERARLAKAAKAKGKKAKKVPVPKMGPVLPSIDPGFEALAKSKQKLTRAESCLLLASAVRLGTQKVSALERAAASRVAQSG
ncbi:MAG TPA: peptidoglycan DD-metalloendopeptidase family protein [Acidobacteriota bacterium]|nr:peptidoglycan DD-metalloendopeptidase family protein [Acidobacteriota bacterium]